MQSEQDHATKTPKSFDITTAKELTQNNPSKPSMQPPIFSSISPYLSASEVAAIEGVGVQVVHRWCRYNLIAPQPVQLKDGRWLIARNYFVTQQLRPGRPPNPPKRKRPPKPRGRPLGSKNKKKGA